jgi:hypothetical protein
MESSYAASERMKNSVAVGTTEIGLSPSRLFIFPGLTEVKPSICIFGYAL